jgi:hypothetical protein
MHVISSEKISHASELMQQAVFEAKQWRRSHDGGLREDISYDSLTPCLNHVSLSLYLLAKRDSM